MHANIRFHNIYITLQANKHYWEDVTRMYIQCTRQYLCFIHIPCVQIIMKCERDKHEELLQL